MKLLTKTILTGLTFCFAMPICNAEPIGPTPGEVVPVQNFELSISASSGEFQGGMPIAVDIQLKNVDTKTHEINDRDGLLGFYKIEVTNEKGEAVPLTTFGKRRARPQPIFSIGFLDVVGGESIKTQLPVSRMYDMSDTGTYSVKVKRRVITTEGGEAIDAVSNTLQIKVQ